MLHRSAIRCRVTNGDTRAAAAAWNIQTGDRFVAAGAAFETTISGWNSPAGRARAGGDWCDVFSVSRDVTALTIGDVSGHGEPVAAIAEFMRSSIVKAIDETQHPAQILSTVNRLAYGRHGGVIVTAIVVILDRRRQTLCFANAGHPPPIMVFPSDHTFLSRSPGDLPLGIFPNHQAADYVIALPDDALVVLYTDGVTEHDRDSLNGEDELARACRLVYDSSEREAASTIAEHVFQTERGSDDAAILAARIVWR
jgi:serine phosphatase RsbU (regulator of sigma subunit)